MAEGAQIPAWRRLSGAGGLALGIAFLLPAARGCNSDVVPAKELATDFGRMAWVDAVSMSAMWLLPYLFGCVVALHALTRREGARRSAAIAAAGVVISAIAVAAARAVWDLAHDQNLTTAVLLGAAATISVLYAARTAKRRSAALLCLRWYGALLCVLWFGGWWIVLSETRYGLWTSLLGAAAVFAACVWEVSTTTGLDAGASCGALATASVPDSS